MQRIIVIDGQGGGIGSAVIRKLREAMGDAVEIIALGTNAIATAQMLKAKANRGASGENAIVHSVRDADAIVGSVAILMANAMMGELTPKMAMAIADSRPKKFLLPLSQENITIAGVSKEPLPHLIDALIEQVRQASGRHDGNA